MAPLIPPAKRRRLTSPTKPFRPPLKSNAVTAIPSGDVTDTGHKQDKGTPIQASEALDHASTFLNFQKTSTPTTPDSNYRIKRSKISDRPKHLTQIRKLRSEIDTINQATLLLNGSRDEELKVLTCKWRTASQAAADQLFGFMKERIENLGGVKSLEREERDSARRRREWAADAFAEKPKVNVRDLAAASCGQKRDWEMAEDTASRSGGGSGESPSDAGSAGGDENDVVEDKTFTMAMMLRKLNIDFDTIGFDSKEERWKDA